MPRLCDSRALHQSDGQSLSWSRTTCLRRQFNALGFTVSFKSNGLQRCKVSASMLTCCIPHYLRQDVCTRHIGQVRVNGGLRPVPLLLEAPPLLTALRRLPLFLEPFVALIILGSHQHSGTSPKPWPTKGNKSWRVCRLPNMHIVVCYDRCKKRDSTRKNENTKDPKTPKHKPGVVILSPTF